MIFESHYWKDPLLELVLKIQEWEQNKNLREPELSDIERELMVGFYSVRKLAQSNKLSDKILDENLKVLVFPNIKKVNLMNKFWIQKNFDLQSSTEKSLNIKFLYNQIIHSYIFVISESQAGGLNGINFCSDYKKNEALYFLSTEEIKRIFRKVGKDYPAQGHMVYNEEKGDYDISIGKDNG
ncbi:MAG: hypothetical protein WED10_10855 [Brumimicrobium sp.]